MVVADDPHWLIMEILLLIANDFEEPVTSSPEIGATQRCIDGPHMQECSASAQFLGLARGGRAFVVSTARRTSSGLASAAPAPSFTLPSFCGTAMGLTSTGATPRFFRPSWPAAFRLTSTIRSPRSGPRSWILTVAVFPVSKLVTLAVVPSGSALLAATFWFGFILRSSAIFRPANFGA